MEAHATARRRRQLLASGLAVPRCRGIVSLIVRDQNTTIATRLGLSFTHRGLRDVTPR